jgi:hypothetical protein
MFNLVPLLSEFFQFITCQVQRFFEFFFYHNWRLNHED